MRLTGFGTVAAQHRGMIPTAQPSATLPNTDVARARLWPSPAAAPPFTVLLAYDFSEASGYAFDQAARVARRVPGADIHVVHVIEAGATDEQAKRVSDELLVYLGDKVKALGGLEEHAVGVHVRCGSPPHEIAELAKDVSADVIVVGVKKGPHLKQLLLGSVTDEIMAATRCPVLVAGPVPHMNDTDPTIDPPCMECFVARRDSQGGQWWCVRHGQHHAKAHSYSFHREIPLRAHDSAILPTGVDTEVGIR